MNSDVKLVVRLPAHVRDWLRGYAKKRDRSMNRQLVSMLRESMATEKENAPEAATSDASTPKPNPTKDKEYSDESY